MQPLLKYICAFSLVLATQEVNGQCYSDILCTTCNVDGLDTISCAEMQDFSLFVDVEEFSTGTVDVIYNIDNGTSMRFSDLQISNDSVFFSLSEIDDFDICVDSVLVGTAATQGDTCVLSGVCLRIKVSDPPTPSIDDPGLICFEDDPVQLVGMPSGGTFSGSGVSAGGEFDPAIADTGATTIIYEVTVEGCVGSIMRAIDVFATPSTSFTKMDVSQCGGSDGSFTLNTGIPNATLQIIDGSGTNDFTTDNNGDYTFNNSPAMTYIFTLSNNGCESDQIEIIINEPGAPDVTLAGPIDVCSNGDAVVFDGMPSGGEYSGDGVDPVTGVFNPVGLAPNTYTITYEVVENGCVGSAMTVIEVLAAPVTFATNDGPACVGEDLQLDSGGGDSYSWSGPQSFSDIAEDPEISNVTSGAAGVYQVIASLNNGCTDTATTTVIVNDLPIATASNTGPVCTGASFTLNSSGAGAMGSYAWDGPNGFTSIMPNPTINNATTTASGTYTVEVTDVNGCKSTTTTDVTVNAGPIATASNTGGYCPGATILLSATGGSTYMWSGPDGFSSSNPTPTITNANSAKAGVYSVTVTDGNMCTAVATTSVTVFPPASTSASNSGPFCVDDTIQLATSGTTGSTYSWTGPQSFSSSQQNPSAGAATVAKSGTYRVTITDSNTCTASSSTVVTVNNLPNAMASVATDICAGETLNLSATGGTMYEWTGPAGFTSTQQNPSVTNADISRAGAYTVVVTNANGCSDNAVTNAIVHPLPTALAQNDGPYCAGETINLSSNGGNQYAWSGPGGYSSDVQNPSIPNSMASNTGVYAILVTDVNGCTGTASSTVTVHPLPAADIEVSDDSGISDDNTICVGDQISLEARPTGISYKWSNTANGSTSGTVQVAPLMRSVYEVTVTDNNGCTDDRSTTIEVNENPEASFLYESRFSSLIYGSDFDLTNTSIISPDATSNQITWCFDPENAVDLRGQSVNSQFLDSVICVNANSTNAQEIDITLKVVDDNMCSDEAADLLSVTSLGCSASTTHDNNRIYCEGDDVSISYTIALDQGENVLSAQGRLLDENDQVVQTYTGNAGPSVTFDIQSIASGDYKFEFRFTTNLDDCSDAPNTNTIKVEKQPEVSFVDASQESFCLSDASYNVQLFTNFDQLLFSNEVIVDYNLVQGGETVELSRRFNPQQSLLSIPVSSGIGLLDTGAFIIEIVGVSIENCPAQAISVTKPVRLFDELTVRPIEDDCNTDGSFDLLFAVNGGSGNYTFDRLPAGVEPVLVNEDSSYYLVTLPPSYSFDIIDPQSACQLVLFDNNLIPPANCDCGEVQANTNAGQLSTSIMDLLDGTYRICSESSFTVSASGVNLQRDSSMQANTDELLLLVTPSGTTAQDIDADRSLIRNTAAMSRVGANYETEVTGLAVGQYTLYTAVVERNAPITDACIKTSSTLINVIAYRTPAPMILLEDDEFCANASNVLATGLNLVDPGEDGYEGSQYTWQVTDGSTIVGTSTSTAVDNSSTALHLSETDTGGMYQVLLTETIDYRGTTCATMTSVPITTSSNVAPDTASIIYWAGNILACTADTTAVIFNWGYVDLTTGQEVNLGDVNQQFLLADDDILSLLEQRSYYVDLRDRNDPDNRCSTRIYFTPSEALEREHGSATTITTFYPNPSDGNIKINLIGQTRGTYQLIVYDFSGRVVGMDSMHKDGYARSMALSVDQPPGLYFLRVISPDGDLYSHKLIIQ